MLPYFTEKYGNASSPYKLGQASRESVDKARQCISDILNVKPDEIYFTSGGSESDNMIIKGIAHANKHKGNHIITTKIEHMAVLNTCIALEKEGFEVTYLSPDENGIVSPEKVRAAIKDNTILITIMFANNEIGTIQDIKAIGEIAKFKGIPFHTDAVQAAGNVKLDVQELNIDAMSLSAHKFYGPKGIGIAYISNKVKFSPLIDGGHQERSKRAGTENVPSIIGAAKALEIADKNIKN